MLSMQTYCISLGITLFIGVIAGCIITQSGVDKKIEDTKIEQQQMYQSKLEEKDKEFIAYKNSIENQQQNNIVTTTEVTKKDGDIIKKVVVNHTKYRIIYDYNEQSLNLKQESQTINASQTTHIQTEKKEIVNSLKTFSLALYTQVIPIDVVKNIHLELGVRIFQTPLWASSLIGPQDKSLSLGLRMEF